MAAGGGSGCSRVRTSGKRFGFDGARRLARKADFERLLRSGVRRSLSGYTFYMSKRDAGPPRLGMMVTRRHAAASTDRNHIKRCIREAFRLEQERLGPLDLIVRPPLGARPRSVTVARLRELFARLEP